MPELLRMPGVAAGQESATVAAWSVAENQAFAANDSLVTVETAKAAVDIEAESDGVLLKILAAAGVEVPAGEPLAVIGAPGEVLGDLDAAVAAPASPARAAEPPAVTPVAQGAPPAADLPRTFASPLARRLAREAGVGVDDIVGTGPNGRVVRADVDAVLAARDGGAAVPAREADGEAPAGEWSEEPHSKARRLVAVRLAESKSTIPHFYVRATLRADRLLAVRAELNAALPSRVSVNDLVLKAVAVAHGEVPDLNVVWTETAVRRYRDVDLGVAIASPRGLVTPVVRGVEKLGVAALAAATRDLAQRAAAGQLKQAELEGGTCTVTNLGMYGAEEFTAIINPPQASILAVGAARPDIRVTAKGRIRPATTIRVVLSVDHRAVDGAVAAQWMAALREAVERPLRLLA